jgi:hypothetical protein
MCIQTPAGFCSNTSSGGGVVGLGAEGFTPTRFRPVVTGAVTQRVGFYMRVSTEDLSLNVEPDAGELQFSTSSAPNGKWLVNTWGGGLPAGWQITISDGCVSYVTA